MTIIKCKKIINEKYLSEFAPFRSSEEFERYTYRNNRGNYTKKDLLKKYLFCKEHLEFFIKTRKIKEEEIILMNNFETPYKFNMGEYILGHKIIQVEWINNNLVYTINKIITEEYNNIQSDFLNEIINELEVNIDKK